MRARQLREMSDEELDKKMAETRKELFQLRFQTATGALELVVGHVSQLLSPHRSPFL